jgi:hypothetical protein
MYKLSRIAEYLNIVSAAMLALIITIVVFWIVFQATPAAQPADPVPPTVLILGIESVETFTGRECWYINYLLGDTPHQVALESPEHMARFIEVLESRYTVDWLGVAQ